MIGTPIIKYPPPGPFYGGIGPGVFWGRGVRNTVLIKEHQFFLTRAGGRAARARAVQARGADEVSAAQTRGPAHMAFKLKSLERRFLAHVRDLPLAQTMVERFSEICARLRESSRGGYGEVLELQSNSEQTICLSICGFGDERSNVLLLECIEWATRALTTYNSLVSLDDSDVENRLCDGFTRGAWESIVIFNLRDNLLYKQRQDVLDHLDEMVSMFKMGNTIHEFERILITTRDATEMKYHVEPSFRAAIQRIDNGIMHKGSWFWCKNSRLRKLITTQSEAQNRQTTPVMRSENASTMLRGAFMPAFDYNMHEELIRRTGSCVETLRSSILEIIEKTANGEEYYFSLQNLILIDQNCEKILTNLLHLGDMRSTHAIEIDVLARL